MNIVDLYHHSSQEHRRQISFAVNQVINGKCNSTGTFTCMANVVSTVVVNERVSSESHINFTPTTANASTENIYIVAGNGQFTVNHANAATTDRTFTYSVQTV